MSQGEAPTKLQLAPLLLGVLLPNVFSLVMIKNGQLNKKFARCFLSNNDNVNSSWKLPS